MNLKTILRQIFKRKHVSEIEEIKQCLENQGICSIEDLKYLEEIHLSVNLLPTEKKKLLDRIDQREFGNGKIARKEKYKKRKRFKRITLAATKNSDEKEFLHTFSGYLQEMSDGLIKLMQTYQYFMKLTNQKNWHKPSNSKFGRWKNKLRKKTDTIFTDLNASLKKYFTYHALSEMNEKEISNEKRKATLSKERKEILRDVVGRNQEMFKLCHNTKKLIIFLENQFVDQSSSFIPLVSQNTITDILKVSTCDVANDDVNEFGRKTNPSTTTILIRKPFSVIANDTDQVITSFTENGFVNNTPLKGYFCFLLLGWLLKLTSCESIEIECQEGMNVQFMSPRPEKSDDCRFKKAFHAGYIVRTGQRFHRNTKYELDETRTCVTLKKCEKNDEGDYLWMCGKSNTNKQFTLKVNRNTSESVRCQNGRDVSFKYPQCDDGLHSFTNHRGEYIMRSGKMNHHYHRFKLDTQEGHITLKNCVKNDEGKHVWTSPKCNVVKQFDLKVYYHEDLSINENPSQNDLNNKSSGNRMYDAVWLTFTSAIIVRLEITKLF